MKSSNWFFWVGFLYTMFLLGGCATAPQARVPTYGGALPELMRAGEPETEPQVEPFPTAYNAISHTCISTPIFDMNGRYVRTSVQCW